MIQHDYPEMNAQCFPIDRISTLPKDIIENILCRVQIRAAARTSILSRNWRYSWLTIPELKFWEWDFELTTDENQLSVSEPNDKLQSERKNGSNRLRMVNAAYQILLVHRGPIEEFALHMNKYQACFEKDETFAKVDQIILRLSNNYSTLKKLDLGLSVEYRVPSSIFLLHQLTDLSLCECKFDHHPTTFNGFGSLTSLHVDEVYTSTETLIHLLSNSPILKSFTLSLACENHDHSNYTCDYIHNSSSAISELFKCLPSVEYLDISHNAIQCFADDAVPQKLPTSLLHLKSVCFSDMFLSDNYGLPFLLLLIRCSPNLEKIQLMIYHCQDEDEDEDEDEDDSEKESVDYSDIYLAYLKELDINILNNINPEMEFVKVILGKSPVLKKVRIVPYHYFGKEKELKMLRSLLCCPHASPIIDIDVEECPCNGMHDENTIQLSSE